MLAFIKSFVSGDGLPTYVSSLKDYSWSMIAQMAARDAFCLAAKDTYISDFTGLYSEWRFFLSRKYTVIIMNLSLELFVVKKKSSIKTPEAYELFRVM